MNSDLTHALQRRIASTSIGASTARGMGPKGTIAAAQRFLTELPLKQFRCRTPDSFCRVLDRTTQAYLAALPRGARHWGAARKFLNIFLRGVVYNRHLCSEYGLARIEPWLELPLDSHVASGLRVEQGGASLPRWRTIIGLEPKTSRLYQDFATQVAQRKRIHRIHLDLLYWRSPNRQS